MGRLPEDGEYYATQTLLGGDIDRNRRMLYRWREADPDGEPICYFNYHMKEWTPEHEKRLQFIVDTLNATRASEEQR